MDRGWIKLHRKLMDNELWKAEPFTKGQAMVDLLMLANHKDGFIYKRGNHLNVSRGQVGWSQIKLSERWGWSRPKIKRFINDLEKDGFLLQQNNNVSSLITILNYNIYQGDVTPDVAAEKQQKSSRRYTNKNDKNVKNEKNTNRFIPPTVEEVSVYCEERDNGINAQAFVNHYETTGWKRGNTKIKDWKACVRTWEQNNKQRGEYL